MIVALFFEKQLQNRLKNENYSEKLVNYLKLHMKIVTIQ